MLISSILSKLKLNHALDVSACITASLVAPNKLHAVFPQIHQPRRHYAFKSDLKIKWVRPQKVECILPEKSGDLKPLPTLEPSQLHADFVDCKTVNELCEEQKQLYTLDYLPQKKSTEMLNNQTLATVQRHPLDYGSMESTIAKQTIKIRSLQKHMMKFPKDKRSKVALKELIDKRKKFLKYLRRWDYKRFEWLLEKLDIVYRPPPEEFHWITRRESLTILTQEHCDNIKQTRLDAYREQLEAEKQVFQKEKEELLRWIEEEEKACGVTKPTLVKQAATSS